LILNPLFYKRYADPEILNLIVNNLYLFCPSLTSSKLPHPGNKYFFWLRDFKGQHDRGRIFRNDKTVGAREGRKKEGEAEGPAEEVPSGEEAAEGGEEGEGG
jgi:hypothetical protein